MGDVIRASAAVEDILKDARGAYTTAVAKEGVIKQRAEEGLGPVLAVIDATEADLKTARDARAPLLAALAAENDRADAVLNRIYDETWNDVGRPANDRYLALMFPGGAGYYTDGPTEEQPTRMELLAKLDDRKLHPKLTADQCTAFATRVRDAATDLQNDVDAVTSPNATVSLLERVRMALARTAQFELANLKRSFKNLGMTESAIHEIIPDRPVAKKVAGPAGPGSLASRAAVRRPRTGAAASREGCGPLCPGRRASRVGNGPGRAPRPPRPSFPGMTSAVLQSTPAIASTSAASSPGSTVRASNSTRPS